MQLLQRGNAVADELAEHAAGPGAIVAGPERFDPFAVVAHARMVVGTLDQAAAENALEIAEAAVAQRLGEAHHGRRLHADTLGETRDRVQRHGLRVLERIGRDAPQLRREPGIDARQVAFELFETAGRRHGLAIDLRMYFLE
jgi:hypothetical protein